MKLTEIIAGTMRGGRAIALRVEPRPIGVTVIAVDALGTSAAAAALAIRETLASPERSAAKSELPFVRVSVRAGELELHVGDDAGAGGRMLTETRGGGVPLVLETDARARDREDRDARIETLLGRVAIAAGVEDHERLLAALAREPVEGAPREAAAPEEELAYVEAHSRAAKLAREVRAIDDRMTASVVPDWLWIATGLGGAGVFMTVIALLYPELRIYVIPALLALSIVGFAAYAARAMREMKTRGVLLVERAELRARREEARAEARAHAESLRAKNIDPALVLVRLAGAEVPANVPSILARDRVTREELAQLAQNTVDRQIIFFAADAREAPPEALRTFAELSHE